MFRKIAETRNKAYVRKDGLYLDMEKDKQIYEDLKEVCDRFSTEEHLLESMHSGNAQNKECLNMPLAQLAPKTMDYSHSLSLSNRVAINSRVQNNGQELYWTNMYRRVGVMCSNNFIQHLQKTDKRREKTRVRKNN